MHRERAQVLPTHISWLTMIDRYTSSSVQDALCLLVMLTLYPTFTAEQSKTGLCKVRSWIVFPCGATIRKSTNLYLELDKEEQTLRSITIYASRFQLFLQYWTQRKAATQILHVQVAHTLGGLPSKDVCYRDLH